MWILALYQEKLILILVKVAHDFKLSYMLPELPVPHLKFPHVKLLTISTQKCPQSPLIVIVLSTWR